MSESSELTGPLVAAIRKCGVMCLRMNSGKAKVRGGYLQLHEKGTADILCFPRGRVVWLETKAVAKDYHKEQQKSQADFRAQVLALGHEHHVIRSLAEGLAAVR